MNTRYYTTFEASHFLGVSLPTVVNWIKAGRLKAHRTPGGHRRIARDELSSFIRRHGMPMPPELADRGEAARILVVHEKAAGEQVGTLLKRAGYECKSTNNAFAAGLALVEFKPDLVMVDVSMPGLEGATAISELRARDETSRLPVIALTAARDDKAQRKALSAGFDDCLHKPFDLQVLKGKVENLLRARREG